MQPEVIIELNNCLGIDTQSLPSQAQTVLALALTEKHVTNERLRYVLRLHKSDITTLLQHMCRQGLLLSDGYGRGTKYRLACNFQGANVTTKETDANVDSLRNSKDDVVNHSISAGAQFLLKKKRLSQSDMKNLLCEIASEWRTIQELATILGKDKTYLRNHVLPTFISKGVLEREYPAIPNHPNQRYRKSDDL